MPPTKTPTYMLEFPEATHMRVVINSLMAVTVGNDVELHESKRVVVGQFRLSVSMIADMQNKGIKIKTVEDDGSERFLETVDRECIKNGFHLFLIRLGNGEYILRVAEEGSHGENSVEFKLGTSYSDACQAYVGAGYSASTEKEGLLELSEFIRKGLIADGDKFPS